MVSRLFRCDEGQVRRLLTDTLADPERSALIEHLEDCLLCRELLEATAAPGPWWADLRRLDSQAAAHPPTESVAAGGDPEAGLDFLGPAQRPGELGTFGPYRVLAVVGRGGTGVVLKAFDPALHRLAAIKVLAPPLAVGSAARQRFTREARAAASINHDNVVPIHAVAEEGGLPYLVMPFIAGQSLQERIDRAGPLQPEEVARVGMQVAAGLAAAHAQGLIHRDIKPANILLESDLERVRITDFGLARAADDASLTHSGVIAGTPQYMAPEQARGDAVDPRADLFSLGSVLYAMCTGRSPFRAETAMGVLRRVCEDEPRPLRAVAPQFPAWLDRVVVKLLAKAPADRFATAAEVADLLGRCLAHVREPGRCPLPALPAARAPRSNWGGPRRLLVAGGMALAMGVLALALGVIIRVRTPEGTLVIEVEDPAASVRIDGDDLIIAGVGVHEIRLPVGVHQVSATRDDKAFLNRVITVERNGKPTVTVRREAPNPTPEVAKLANPVVTQFLPFGLAPPDAFNSPTRSSVPLPLKSKVAPLPAPPLPRLDYRFASVAELDAIRLDQMKRLAVMTDLWVTEQDKYHPRLRQVELAAGPVGRWRDPEFDVADGSLWVWGRQGRPIAVVAFELHQNEPNGPSWGHEFTSLSDRFFSVSGPGFGIGVADLEPTRSYPEDILWSPQPVDLKFRDMPRTDAPVPVKELRQQRIAANARRFATGVLNGNRVRFEVGPHPAITYEDKAAGILDGALYTLGKGENPEALLLIEAQGPSPDQAVWRYALALMTRAAITVELDGEPVWDRPYTSRPPITAAYFNANRPQGTTTDLPGR